MIQWRDTEWQSHRITQTNLKNLKIENDISFSVEDSKIRFSELFAAGTTKGVNGAAMTLTHFSLHDIWHLDPKESGAVRT